MLFHLFGSQEERRAFGGGDFIQLVCCSLEKGTPMGTVVSNEAVAPLLWMDDSLYIYGDDWNEFYDAYGEIITGGTYSNLEQGCLDWCGINYFSPEQTMQIKERIRQEKPKDAGALLAWLEQAAGSNGFYVLGL